MLSNDLGIDISNLRRITNVTGQGEATQNSSGRRDKMNLLDKAQHKLCNNSLENEILVTLFWWLVSGFFIDGDFTNV